MAQIPPGTSFGLDGGCAQGGKAEDGHDHAIGDARDRNDFDKDLRKHGGVRSTRPASHVQTFGHLGSL